MSEIIESLIWLNLLLSIITTTIVAFIWLNLEAED